MGWQRARSDAQKAEREHDILNAAARLFAQVDYADITLNSIAREAGFTRSNVYRYFATREEIFLRLYLDALVAWADAVKARLAELSEGASPSHISDALVASLLSHERLLDLSPLLSVILERNTSEQALIDAKLDMVHHLSGLHDALERLIPGLTQARSYMLMSHIHALASGLWSAANPNDVQERIYAHPGLCVLRVDFEPFISTGVRALISDLMRGDAEP